MLLPIAEYEFGGQGMQVTDVVDEYLPFWQNMHDEEPEIENCPERQGTHAEDPDTILYLPASQATQLVLMAKKPPLQEQLSGLVLFGADQAFTGHWKQVDDAENWE